jgi:hypothetical protein
MATCRELLWYYIDALLIQPLYQPSHRKAESRTERVRKQNSEQRESADYIWLPAKDLRNLTHGFLMQDTDFVFC